MAKKEKAPLTRDKEIAKAYKDIDDMREIGYDIDVPANRRLGIGTKVEIGNLEDCVVVEHSDNYKRLIIEFTRTDNNYGNPITTSGHIGGWAWFDVVPAQDDNELEFATRRTQNVSFMSGDLTGLINGIFRRGMVDNPDYQRGYVWTAEDKLNYIRTVFEDRDLGKFVMVEDRTYKDYRVEILDGKQRLSALLGFVTSQFTYEGKYWHELSKWDRMTFEGRMVQSATIDRNVYSRTDLLKLFLEVNAAGVPQTEEHLDYVRGLLEDELTP